MTVRETGAKYTHVDILLYTIAYTFVLALNIQLYFDNSILLYIFVD
jgi:hypothetical protein